ncbi:MULTISPECIES: hypothetical protein [unclassified Kitasatospora]|uniref:hypothetical protein n=1 Tax=unclassified Kitasatospora TaxID=2633591 RepID=UPI003410A082
MLLLGLLLMSASGAFVGLLIADNLSGGPDYQVTILGNDLVTLNTLGVFLSGVALALLFCLGLALMRSTRRAGRAVGAARPARRRVAYQEAEPVEPVEPVERVEPVGRSAPAERAAPVDGERAYDDRRANDERAYDERAYDDRAYGERSYDDRRANDERAYGDRAAQATGSDEGFARPDEPPSEEQAAEQGGREASPQPGGRIRHLFGR